MQNLMLETRNFGFSQEWKTECQEWCQQQNMAQNEKELMKNLREQWLQTDICIEGVQQKVQIKNPWLLAKKIVIKDTAYLQVQSGIDISQSAFSQLQAKLKVDVENSVVSAENQNPQPSWEPKPSRCLLLSLTDGFKTISAVEHEPISQLKVILPGMKIAINGPLVCRKGVMLLTSRNVKLLGGHVIELNDKYNEKKILSERVGRDLSHLQVSNNRQPISTTETNTATGNEPFADDDDDFFKNVEMPPIVGSNPKIEKQRRRDVEQNPKPFTYLKYVPKDENLTAEESYAIKGTIVSLASKLRVCRHPMEREKFTWELLVIVSDGTDNRSFNVSSDLLLSWIGIHPKKYDKANKDEFKKSLEKTANHLLTFNGIMKIKKGEEKIVIFQMNPLNRGHLQQLKIRQGLV